MAEEKFEILSLTFKDGGYIPINYSCDGENINPFFTISGTPKNAKSLVLIMEDPDIQKKFLSRGVFDHWIIWNIPPELSEIEEGVAPKGIEGKNSEDGFGYIGPCPPEGEEHRYFFRLYALDIILDLKKTATRRDLEQAMEGHILDESVLMGKYKRKQ